jgi:hypothetical protein
MGYPHHPLDPSSDQIRLLRVRRWANYRLRFSIDIFSLRKAPQYTALSYTWGPEKPTFNIKINGKDFEVRENLQNFLEQVRDGSVILQKYSLSKQSYIWIDQICIDQLSTTEKTHQVRLMRDIFSTATNVIAWLGPRDEQSDQAMNLIKELWQCKDAPEDTEAVDDFKHFLRGKQSYYHPIPSSLRSLFQRKYWTRVWVLQEFLLAQNLTFACGACTASGEALRYFYSFWNSKIREQSLDVLADAAKMLQLQTERTSVSFDLYRLLSVTARLGCSNPQDRIYGVLGIASGGGSIPIDYGIPPQELFWKTLEALPPPSTVGFIDMQPFLFQLGLAMNVTGYEQAAKESGVLQFWQWHINIKPAEFFKVRQQFRDRGKKLTNIAKPAQKVKASIFSYFDIQYPQRW